MPDTNPFPFGVGDWYRFRTANYRQTYAGEVRRVEEADELDLGVDSPTVETTHVAFLDNDYGQYQLAVASVPGGGIRVRHTGGGHSASSEVTHADDTGQVIDEDIYCSLIASEDDTVSYVLDGESHEGIPVIRAERVGAPPAQDPVWMMDADEYREYIGATTYFVETERHEFRPLGGTFRASDFRLD